MNKEALLKAVLPVGALVVLAGAWFFHGTTESAAPEARKKVAGTLPVAPPSSQPEVLRRAEPPPPPKIDPPQTVGKAMEDERVRTTFQNFRTAVATGNEALVRALRPILLRSGKQALDLAQEDLSRAQSDLDREIAQKTLEAIRRHP
jgi:hypothetical protein